MLPWLAANARRDLEKRSLSFAQIQLRLTLIGLEGKNDERNLSLVRKYFGHQSPSVRLQALIALEEILGAENYEYQVAAYRLAMNSSGRLEELAIDLEENPVLAQAPLWDEYDLQIEALQALVGRAGPLPEIVLQYLENLMVETADDPLISEFIHSLLESSGRSPDDEVYRRLMAKTFELEKARHAPKPAGCEIILFPSR